MEDNVGALIGKISSYNLFNNFLPGLVFCFLIDNFTDFSISGEMIWINVFVYYFVGMVLSRIGSLFVENALKAIKREKPDGTKWYFLEFADYKNYEQASEHNSFIRILNETNNMYRTFIVVFLVVALIKLFDIFFYDSIHIYFEGWGNAIFIILCVGAIFLFIFSYRKQTMYIRERVENYVKETSDEENVERRNKHESN